MFGTCLLRFPHPASLASSTVWPPYLFCHNQRLTHNQHQHPRTHLGPGIWMWIAWDGVQSWLAASKFADLSNCLVKNLFYLQSPLAINAFQVLPIWCGMICSNVTSISPEHLQNKPWLKCGALGNCANLNPLVWYSFLVNFYALRKHYDLIKIWGLDWKLLVLTN